MDSFSHSFDSLDLKSIIRRGSVLSHMAALVYPTSFKEGLWLETFEYCL
jgi:hypothetical protein